MTDDLIQLASTYLDGVATPDERVRVEGDAELLAEVERLRRVRSVLADVEPPRISVRERHLAAALDAWDRLPSGEQSGDLTGSDATTPGDAAAAAGGAAITAPTSLRAEREKRRAIGPRILTAAAAILLVGGVGFVAQNALSGTDDESIDLAESSDAAPAEASAELALEPDPIEIAEETFDTADEAGVAADVAEAPSPPSDLAADVVIGGPEMAAGNGELEVLDGNEELAQFANDRVIATRRATTEAEPVDDEAASDQAADADATAADSPTPASPTPTLAPPVDLCGLVDEVVGFAFWAGGQVDTPIVVGIDNVRSDAVAYDPDTCTLISRTPLLPIDD